MSYPWPLAETDLVLEEALDIALDYLECTGQAFPFSETQRQCAHVILDKWRAGVKHRIKLANYAIVAIEQNHAPAQGTLHSLYPRVS
jgi:hypothetical protein